VRRCTASEKDENLRGTGYRRVQLCRGEIKCQQSNQKGDENIEVPPSMQVTIPKAFPDIVIVAHCAMPRNSRWMISHIAGLKDRAIGDYVYLIPWTMQISTYVILKSKYIILDGIQASILLPKRN
jgi:hypothetical protein